MESMKSSELAELSRMYIGGEWVESSSGKRYDVINPADGELLVSVPSGDEKDVDIAFGAADKAFDSWKRVSPEERGEMVRKLGQAVSDGETEFATIESMNVGHPVRAMRGDVRIGVKDLVYFAGIYPELGGETIPGAPGKVLNYTVREPFGVVGRIVPFNHPLMFALQSLGAPLVAGNTVILKPASITPLSALRLGKEVGRIFPPGVVNIVTGPGSRVGAALGKHPGIRRLALTGSVETGKELARLGAEQLKYITLELGGKNPIIILPDVDVDVAVAAAIKGMNFTWTASQSCQSTSRCFVHEAIHDEFVKRLAAAMQKIRLGVPTVEETEMGALSSRSQLEKVEEYVSVGLSEGAVLLAGGKKPERPELSRGFFYEPTLFDNVSYSSRLAQEEIFGPVLSVIEWSDEKEMLREVNSVQFGLTALILTRDVSSAHRIAGEVQAGYVWINGPTTTRGVPFGGYKMSGMGRQGSIEELLSYTQEKSVQVTL